MVKIVEMVGIVWIVWMVRMARGKGFRCQRTKFCGAGDEKLRR